MLAWLAARLADNSPFGLLRRLLTMYRLADCSARS
jgi:hypothetical protein